MAILAGFTVTLLWGGNAVLRGDLEVGLFSVLVYMTQRLLWPLTRLGETLDLYQRAMASTRRILDLLAVPPSIVDGGRAAARTGAGRRGLRARVLRLRRRPPGDHRPRPARARPARPTPSSARPAPASRRSSSSCSACTTRQSGHITIDGVAADDLSFTSLRGAMGYVGQDVFLFQGTVRENIAYGRPDATDAEVEEAARLAEAHDFIVELPNGLRHRRRRAGPEALGRPAPAALDRPGHPRATPRSWCSTRRPPRSTTRPRRRSSARSRPSGGTARCW